MSFSPSVASILEAYDPYMVKVLESCIPSYNTGLRYRLGGDFLDADVVCNKSFFEALGRYLFSEEAYKAASQAFARALQYDEGDPYLHVKVGRSFLVLGDFVQAMKQVQRAIQIKDNEPDFYLFLGELMLAKGDPGGAEAAMRKAEELMR